MRISALMAGAILASCAASIGNTMGPALEENFQLRVGQSVVMAGVPLEVGFMAVIGDSRCGKGEACVWEGDAIVRVWLQRGGGTRQERDLHTAARQLGAASFEDFSLRLVALAPARISGRAISPSAYLATLKLTRGDSDEDKPRYNKGSPQEKGAPLRAPQ